MNRKGKRRAPSLERERHSVENREESRSMAAKKREGKIDELNLIKSPYAVGPTPAHQGAKLRTGRAFAHK